MTTMANPGNRPTRPFALLNPGELDELWDVELLDEEQEAIDAKVAAEPALRAELAPILRTLDYDRRELFISAIARFVGRGGEKLDLAAAAREALDSTRHAAFLLALADQRMRP